MGQLAAVGADALASVAVEGDLTEDKPLAAPQGLGCTGQIGSADKAQFNALAAHQDPVVELIGLVFVELGATHRAQLLKGGFDFDAGGGGA